MTPGTFILALALLAAPLVAEAQPIGKVVRIGFLGAETAADDARRVDALRAGLRDLGYVEGRNLVIESRWGEGNYDRLPDLASELVRFKVDVLVTGGTKAVLGAKRATTTIPIVMASSGDILALGVIASLARPGGNITGTVNLGRELGPKRLDLLKEVMPRITRVAYLVNPANPAFGPNLQAMWTAARALRLELRPFEARGPHDLTGAFTEMANSRIDAVILQDETSFGANAKAIAHLAVANRLPSVGGRTFVEGGGLVGYGPDIRQLARRAAVFVDKILKGAKPADLPVEQPTTFEFVINLKTARALGLAIPATVLARADEIIE